MDIKEKEIQFAEENGLVCVDETTGLMTLTSNKLENSVDALGIPDKSWNIAEKGAYNFNGEAQGSPLYTDYWLTGITHYRSLILNHHETRKLTVYVDIKGLSGTLKKVTVGPKEAGILEYVAESTSKEILLKFSAPSNFSGYIRNNG